MYDFYLTLYFFVKTTEKVIRLCTVLTFFNGSFEDMGIFHVFQLSFDGGGVGGYIDPKQKEHVLDSNKI